MVRQPEQLLPERAQLRDRPAPNACERERDGHPLASFAGDVPGEHRFPDEHCCRKRAPRYVQGDEIMHIQPATVSDCGG